MDDLDKLFNPSSIAIVGASKDPSKIGSQILRNVVEYGFKGNVYPINPTVNELLGLKCYPRVSDVPDRVDVAVISVPSDKVLSVIDDCGKAGVKFAVVITSGFKEVGNEELEEELVRRAHGYGIRVLGPNIFGYVYAPSRLNASFGPKDVISGNVAFISQSGALGIALMGYTIVENIGVSAIVSVGNKADIDDVDLLDFFDRDPNTRVMKFIDVAARVSSRKPVVVIKAGRTEVGARAAASHTGSMAGSVAVYESAFKQSGVLMAKSVEEAFDWTKALAWNGVPEGENLVVITNGGGAGVQSTDTFADNGVYLKKPPESLIQEIRKFTPPFASFANPIDMTGMATDDWYYRGALAALRDPEVHAVTVLYCQTAVTTPMGVAKGIVDAIRESGNSKPVTVGMVGGPEVAEAISFLNKQNVAAYPTPERASAAMSSLYAYARAREYVIRSLAVC
ncbi:MAG: CoA-binding protein [Candidatus Korarchaeum sp.]